MICEVAIVQTAEAPAARHAEPARDQAPAWTAGAANYQGLPDRGPRIQSCGPRPRARDRRRFVVWNRCAASGTSVLRSRLIVVCLRHISIRSGLEGFAWTDCQRCACGRYLFPFLLFSVQWFTSPSYPLRFTEHPPLPQTVDLRPVGWRIKSDQSAVQVPQKAPAHGLRAVDLIFPPRLGPVGGADSA
jgi:hypothetical protein